MHFKRDRLVLHIIEGHNAYLKQWFCRRATNIGKQLMPSKQLAKNTYQKPLDDIAGIYDSALRDVHFAGGFGGRVADNLKGADAT